MMMINYGRSKKGVLFESATAASRTSDSAELITRDQFLVDCYAASKFKVLKPPKFGLERRAMMIITILGPRLSLSRPYKYVFKESFPRWNVRAHLNSLPTLSFPPSPSTPTPPTPITSGFGYITL
ncbi:hypothetical protein ACEPAG_3064 [Sanghuangporus baumii]